MRLLCVTGRSGSGKTTLIASLLGSLPLPIRQVGVLKHTHHRIPWHPAGKDTTRFREASPGAVALLDPEQLAIFRPSWSPEPRPVAVVHSIDAPASAAGQAASSRKSTEATLSLIAACRSFPDGIELILAEGHGFSLAPKLWLPGEAPIGTAGPAPGCCRAVAVEAGAVGPWSAALRTIPVFSRDDHEAIARRAWEWADPLERIEARVGSTVHPTGRLRAGGA